MKAKIFLSFLCVFLLINATFAGNPFELPKLKLKSNADQRLWIGDNWVKDSTNYFIMNQGLLVWDSLRVRRDLYVGELGGTIYMDTLRTGKIYFDGLSFLIDNNKAAGLITMSVTSTGSFLWYYGTHGAGTELMTLTPTTGLLLKEGDIQLTGGTQQIKVPSDTASDYGTNDSVTINRQSGKITTKSMSTIAGEDEYVWLTNSLITTSSKIFAMMDDNASATGTPIIRQCKTYSGIALIVVANIHASDGLNGVLTINFLVIN